MLQNYFRFNKNFLLWSLLAGVILSVAALGSQIDLWVERGADWNGVYTVSDLDEPFYTAYVQSILDGKSRRNSPYTGVADTAETLQKESYLSIQYLASYPSIFLAKLFGLSASTTMILLAAIIGFVSAFVLFWLSFIISENAPISFVTTVTTLFCGAFAAGQGGIFDMLSQESVQYPISLLFLRRSVPAMSFPALFLFFVFVYRFFSVKKQKTKIWFGVLAVACFTFTVFSYFYHWTTALAWFFGLVILWAIFKFEDLRENKIYFLGLGGSLLLVLVPYFFLLSNRSTETDSALLLNFTNQPDLWRIPTLTSYLSIGVFLIGKKFGWLNLREPKILFLMSLAFVAPVVFNQQLLTGRSLQPFHYQFFCVNYVAVFSLSSVIFILLKNKLKAQTLNKILLLVGATVFIIGYFENVYAADAYRGMNVWRDELVPVAGRIKLIGESDKNQTKTSRVILSFDFTQPFWTNSVDLPALSSQSVLWSPHLTMFPDVSRKENLERLNKFLYYQNLDAKWLKNQLQSGNSILTLGYFGGVRTNDQNVGESKSVSGEEINKIVEQYEDFCRSFDSEKARTPFLSFVIVRQEIENDLSNIDRWYERDAGETVGKYILYRVKLRQP
jgi:hypothetical protein